MVVSDTERRSVSGCPARSCPRHTRAVRPGSEGVYADRSRARARWGLPPRCRMVRGAKEQARGRRTRHPSSRSTARPRRRACRHVGTPPGEPPGYAELAHERLAARKGTPTELPTPRGSTRPGTPNSTRTRAPRRSPTRTAVVPAAAVHAGAVSPHRPAEQEPVFHHLREKPGPAWARTKTETVANRPRAMSSSVHVLK